jgi:glycerol-1-phosphate dehydrogenase [NAD(P)+]
MDGGQATSAEPRPSAEPGDAIQALLSGRYVDGETGTAVAVETRSIVIEDTLAGAESALVAGLGFGRRLGLISDTQTHKVLGARTERALRGAFDVAAITLPGTPSADEETVAAIRQATAAFDALIAVGSGTINDLTKYASALDGKPYAVFATAPSMNGYTSLTASITQRGHKLTLPAQAPAGAFFDLEVLAAAPRRMIRAGLGDSICRTTAQVDWLLSQLLLGTPYRRLPYDLLANEEPRLLEVADALVAGDREAIRVLVRTLVLSGLGTAIVGSSAPASQAEHLVSHYVDMLAPATRPAAFHGEQVGVATLSIARLHEALLDAPPHFEPCHVRAQDVTDRFGVDRAPSIVPEIEAKAIDRVRADELNGIVAGKWTAITRELAAVHLPPSRLEEVLAAAGAPLSPEDIHLERPFYEAALQHAREIRNRFTVLDVLAASRRLGELIPTV